MAKSEHIHRKSPHKQSFRKKAIPGTTKRLTPKMTKGAFLRDELQRITHGSGSVLFKNKGLAIEIAAQYDEEI
jgi:hypothetical protein